MSEQMRKEFEAWLDGPVDPALAAIPIGIANMEQALKGIAWAAWQAALATKSQVPQMPQGRTLESGLSWNGFKDSTVPSLRQTILDERAALATQPQAPQGAVIFGCHCDLDPGMTPDGCVLDQGAPSDCIHAQILEAANNPKEKCDYWRPIKVYVAAPETPEGDKQ